MIDTFLIVGAYYKLVICKKSIIIQYVFECPMYSDLYVFKLIYPDNIEHTAIEPSQCYYSCIICRHKCYLSNRLVVFHRDTLYNWSVVDRFKRINRLELLVYLHDLKK